MTSTSSHADVIQQTADHVRALLTGDSSGHDWWHIERVWRTAVHIGEREGADLLVVELAALLHDVADWKFHGGDDSLGPKRASQWLGRFSLPREIIDHVADIIAHLSFKGAQVATPMATLEGKVVQDADRLDALGAIGIARAFAYGGHAGRALYDPSIEPEAHATFEAYKRGGGPTLNHFYEKLLLLKDRMNTQAAREMALARHQFMEEFLRRFLAEWNGQA